MTEEENKAIEDLKDILKYWQTIVEIEDDVEREIEMNCYSEEMPFEQLKIALNLITKREEEIEKYKETEQKIKDKINDYKTRTKYIADVYNSIYLEIAKDFEKLLEEN